MLQWIKMTILILLQGMFMLGILAYFPPVVTAFVNNLQKNSWNDGDDCASPLSSLV